MRIRFSQKEEENILIKFKKKRQLSANYIKDRDASWDSLVSQGEKNGKTFWNGTMYSFEGLLQNDSSTPIIYFGEMEYKDRLFKKKLGEKQLIKKYDEENLLIHTGASVNILTRDKKFIIGRKNKSVGLLNNIYAQVGGNLNIDEMRIKTFRDIYKYMLKEMKEEIFIDLKLSKLKFQQISFFDSYCGFDFVYYSDIESGEVKDIKPSSEFLSFEALSYNEILNLKEKGISDFEYSKKTIKDLL